ncbi:beta-L-arabinofuranosidase domain-containing protein [Anaerostipes sp.]|uniref:beta-L-arabinofuranosidase domain-containing protein n=1 Tax=Anaerostipes sp. TaxID=1872530 RepID=UPI0025C6DD28|nr:beta-L-arabinofuranosidase domain-containing protein [Anaerostipes sp.]MBS7009029.1 glycoside hydrolase family 127 protein [Anaerostipes sp.]
MKKLLYKSMAMAMAASFVASSAGPALTNVHASQAAKQGAETLQNPVLNLKFEDNTTDSSGKGNNGTIQGSNSEYIDGIVGKALKLNGNTKIDLGKSTDLQPENLTLSFWMKPNETMTGEQAFTWNKTTYDSDGWYLSSEGNSVPLALSIGPSDTGKQPYKVSVKGTRSEFFPTDQWTHIAVTYDHDTKKVNIYRNGIKQKTTIDYNISESTKATGILGSDAEMEKSIGYNGSKYNGSYIKAALDEWELYNDVADQSEVIALYEAGGKVFDKKAAAKSDLDDISIPAETKKNLELPTEGSRGSVITWKSDNTAVITDNGQVTPPVDQDVTVKMTAKADFEGETEQKTFEVKVKVPSQSEADEKIKNIGLENIQLSDDYLVNASSKENDYLLSMSSKKFLYETYKVAGLTPPTSEGYAGWERSSGMNFRGHAFGHYMSALSQAYRGTSDEKTKEQLMTQIKDAVNGLKECQDNYAKLRPGSAGYVSSFPESILTGVDGVAGPAGGNPGTSSTSNVLVPYYNLHKILAGLLDVSKNIDDKKISDKALSVAENFGEYLDSRFGKLTDKNKMLNTEYGGMNEALYELYNLTGNEKAKDAAQYFDETSLFDDMAAGKDTLDGKHANTTIPKLTGALKRYTVLTQNKDYYEKLTEKEKQELPKYLRAAENFWDMTVKHHTYVTGGNSQAEHFHVSDGLHYDAEERTGYGDGGSTCETCNTYNMLKLTRELFRVTQNKKYMDYYENTYINAILSSQNPETGMTMYFQPMGPGYSKVYSQPYTHFWCCTGTGMESFSKLGDTMYFTEKENVYVNMFFSNIYNYKAQNLKLTQKANMPNSNKVSFKVEALDGGDVKDNTNLKLRIPDWAAKDVTLTKNGKSVAVTDDMKKEGFAVVSDVKAGDSIEYITPMEVTISETQDNKNFISFKYGPVLLSAGLGSNNLGSAMDAGVLVRVATKDSSAQSNITVKGTTINEWKKNVRQNLVRVEDSKDGRVQFKLKNTDSGDLIYTPHYMQHKERYGIYMTFEEEDSKASQERILKKKQALREQEISVDSLTNFDENNSEFEKNLQKSEDSSVGSYNGRQYRDAQKNGWFSYDMQIDPKAEKNYLNCTYITDDKDRTFDIYINGEKFKTETINNKAGTKVFYTEKDEIPEKYLKNPEYKKDSTGEFVKDENGNKVPVVNVKFMGIGTTPVGGLYGINTTNKDTYDTDARLDSLSFTGGNFESSFDKDSDVMIVNASSSASSVKMKASPSKKSGLVYVNDILIDDGTERNISLDKAVTAVNLKTVAQDHKTEKTYTVYIIKKQKDTAALNTVLGIAKKLKKEHYTPNSYQKLLKEISASETVLKNSASEQEEVNAQLDALKKAVDGLVSVPSVAKVSGIKSSANTTSSLKLSWNKVSGASGYEVYKYDSKTKKYVKKADVKGTSAAVTKLSAASPYSFRVRAYSIADGTKYFGSYSSTFNTASAPSKAAGLKVKKASKTKIRVSWKKTKGASGYAVYMKTGNGKYKRVKTVTKGSTVKYIKTKLKKGKKYTFKIRAYKKADKNIYGSYSSSKSLKLK